MIDEINKLQYEANTWRFNVMFDLVSVASATIITGLADFDAVIQGIAALPIGTQARIDLRDWIDEDAFLGSMTLLKTSETELTYRGEDIPEQYQDRLVSSFN